MDFLISLQIKLCKNCLLLLNVRAFSIEIRRVSGPNKIPSEKNFLYYLYLYNKQNLDSEFKQ